MSVPTVYICNTDEITFSETGLTSDVAIWLRNSAAYSGGSLKFLTNFQSAIPGSYVLAYKNKVGVLAVGLVASPLQVTSSRDPEYYLGLPRDSEFLPEHKLKVVWILDLRHSPISLDDLRRRCGYEHGFAPVNAWSRLLPEKDSARIDVIAWLVESAGLTFADDAETNESTASFAEGTLKPVMVNTYERSAAARSACIARWGTACAVCSTDLCTMYGNVAFGFTHVHHIVPIASIGGEYVMDPEQDLRPVCPNCHAMLHRGRGANPRSIEELRDVINAQRSIDRRH